jgi:hypothetical protein
VISVVAGETTTKAHELTLGTGWSPRWIPFQVDLGAFAGERVTLRLELIRPETSVPSAVAQIGYLGSPRIVVRRPR